MITSAKENTNVYEAFQALLKEVVGYVPFLCLETAYDNFEA